MINNTYTDMYSDFPENDLVKIYSKETNISKINMIKSPNVRVNFEALLHECNNR